MRGALLVSFLLACGQGGTAPADASVEGAVPDSGGVPGNSFGYQLEDHDITWFQQHAMPYMVGEGGFNGGGNVPCTVFGGGTWDSVNIPACGSDRGPAVKATTDIFFGSKAASGYLQWGLMVGQDNGEGDKCSGMDTAFHTDFSTLLAVYQARAGLLPAGGSIACP